jgi:hypothetical protein
MPPIRGMIFGNMPPIGGIRCLVLFCVSLVLNIHVPYEWLDQEDNIVEHKPENLVVPTVWGDKLFDSKPPGRTWVVGFSILHHFWTNHGRPVEIAGDLDGASNISYRRRLRALADLEHLGLVEVERHRGHSPIAKIPRAWNTGRAVYGVPLSVIREEYGWGRDKHGS